MGWPRHWVRPEYGFVWIVEEPAAIVTQSLVEHAADASIDALHDVFDELVEGGFLDAHPRALLLHDWRSIKSHDSTARSTWSRRSRARGDVFKKVGTSYVALSASSIVRMTIQAGALAAQLATGGPPVRVIEDPAVVLEAHGIHAPLRDAPSRLRKRGG